MNEVSQDSAAPTAASETRSDGAPESTPTAAAARLPWIGASAASQQTLELGSKVAGSASTVLITGESGAGKDQLARWIHEQGPRRDSPFMKIDCASLPPELVESELFGHEKGAFTGAIATKRGRLEIALGGTIVLDEVAALAPGIQAKLLRVLEERTFERLGGSEMMRLNARLIALTNADLPRAVAAGRFREDLFFRLNVLTIEIPPLRARRDDIRLLAAYFLERLRALHARANLSFSDSAILLLESYDWPGNVRELRNAIEHAAIFAPSDELRPEDFPAILQAARGGRSVLSGLRSLEELERDAIRATLEATRYKIGRAAEVLGISRKTLLEKRKKYGLFEK
jgi:DNA-binding NtrC family response regulator